MISLPPVDLQLKTMRRPAVGNQRCRCRPIVHVVMLDDKGHQDRSNVNVSPNSVKLLTYVLRVGFRERRFSCGILLVQKSNIGESLLLAVPSSTHILNGQYKQVSYGRPLFLCCSPPPQESKTKWDRAGRPVLASSAFHRHKVRKSNSQCDVYLKWGRFVITTVKI